MLRLCRTSLIIASISVVVLCSEIASAQTSGTSSTTTTTGSSTGTATVTATLQQYPDRWLHYGTSKQVDIGASTRPYNLNQYGVSYQDCIDDQTLVFNVNVTGFDGTESLQVWATRSGDCTADTTRGVGAVTATCWMVNAGFTGMMYQSTQSLSFAVRVQDIVGPQNTPPFPANLVHEGASACTAQSTFIAVPMDIFFVPVNSSNSLSGTAYKYSIPGGTDLVGPPAPVSVTTSPGDTLVIVNWTPNSDSDTAGYNLFIDPPFGGAKEVVDATVATQDAALFCAKGGTTGTATKAGATDSGMLSEGGPDDASSVDSGPSGDASVTSDGSSDAGTQCYPVNQGGGGTAKVTGNAMCFSAVLATGFVADSGTTTASVTDEASTDDGAVDDGAIEEASVAVAEGSGGISSIPCNYAVGNLCGTSNITVTGLSNSTYTITGLTNETKYSLAVAAADNFGNVGPPSFEACGTPAPIDDFWKIYREDGGKAGGFCALDSVGSPTGSTLTLVGGGALAIAAVGRRRRRRAR